MKSKTYIVRCWAPCVTHETWEVVLPADVEATESALLEAIHNGGEFISEEVSGEGDRTISQYEETS